MAEKESGHGPFRPGMYDAACRAFSSLLRGDSGSCWEILNHLDQSELDYYLRAVHFAGLQAAEVYERKRIADLMEANP